jgi:drug/metabolite transporter (DMT)-like permease
MKSLRGYFFIIGATTFWGISATAAKFLFSQHLNTLVLVQMRMSFSCIILLVVFGIFRRDLLRVDMKAIGRFALMGIIGGAGSNFTYYFTIEQTNVATAILLQYLAPILVLLFSALSREEEIGIVKISACIVSLAGCFLAVAGKDFAMLNTVRIGLLSGLGSAFCWAFANIWLRHLVKKYNIWTCLVFSFFFASIFWLFFNPPWVIFATGYSMKTWEVFLGFALISVLIPHSFYFIGIRHLTASRAIITATFEPVVAIVSAFALLQEALSLIQIIGAALVILAIGILQIRQEPSQVVQVA